MVPGLLRLSAITHVSFGGRSRKTDRDMVLLTVPRHPRTRAGAIAAGISGVFSTQADVAKVRSL